MMDLLDRWKIAMASETEQHQNDESTYGRECENKSQQHPNEECIYIQVLAKIISIQRQRTCTFKTNTSRGNKKTDSVHVDTSVPPALDLNRHASSTRSEVGKETTHRKKTSCLQNHLPPPVSSYLRTEFVGTDPVHEQEHPVIHETSRSIHIPLSVVFHAISCKS